VTSNAAVSRRLNGGRSDGGIGPEFRRIAGTVCPGHAYGCPYIPTHVAGMQYEKRRRQHTYIFTRLYIKYGNGLTSESLQGSR